MTDLIAGRSFDLVLLDPPRTGAADLLDAFIGIGAERVLYVSCHPGTRNAWWRMAVTNWQLRVSWICLRRPFMLSRWYYLSVDFDARQIM